MAALAGDATTIAVTAAFDRAGIPCLVLKGPSLAHWLYDADEVRAFGDLDLLVAPDHLDAAERQLKALGFINKYDGPSPKFAEEHADMWSPTPEFLAVDLHRRLWGIEAPIALTWRRLWTDRETLVVADREIQILGPAARTLLTALHAAHHGPEFLRPMVDLERAVARLDAAVWDEALALAGGLGATPGLSAGLGMLPAGVVIRDRLGLPPADRATVLRTASMWSEPATAAGFLQLFEAKTRGEQLGLLRRELLPSRAFMVARSEIDGSSSAQLMRAYAARWWMLMRNAPAGYRTARAIRRRS